MPLMIATRDAAVERLEEFLPRAGTAYAKHRNYDHGPGDRTYESQPLSLPPEPVTSGKVGHLITPDDLAPAPETLGPIASRAIIPSIPPNSGKVASRFLESAIRNKSERCDARQLDGELNQSIADWISHENLELVICSMPTLGPWRDLIPAEVPVRPFVRSWDRTLWPKATAGFFKLKKSLPSLHKKIAEDRQLELW